MTKKQKIEINILVGILFGLFLIIFFHLSYWSWFYSVTNPTWNSRKCNDMAYEHFLDLGDWP